MKGRAVCALFVLVSFAFLEADAKKHSRRLESKGLDRKRRSLVDDAWRIGVVKTHNDLRRLEGSSNMKLMRWNDDLEEMAGAFAEKCTSGHNEPSQVPPSSLGYDSVGRNFYAASGPSINSNIAQEFYKEKLDYNHDTGDCSSTYCGHYTQAAWAESHLLGCARSRCATETGSRDAIAYVCHYAPAGNIEGKKPYLKGPPCTQCANENDKCNEGLCDGG